MLGIERNDGRALKHSEFSLGGRMTQCVGEVTENRARWQRSEGL